MTTTEMTRADELLNEIEADGAMPADAALSAPSVVQANPYVGIAAAPFSPEAAEILLGGVAEEDIEIRPDGLIYLPEIKYRRILNRAFGPGAWSLLPMEITVSPQDNMLYYKGALFVLGRFVSEAIGEQQYFPDNDRMSYATAAESAKSNCLMRCCKDLGIASELWDPTFVRGWIARNATEAWCVNVGSRDKGKKKKMWRKREAPPIDAFPWKEEGGYGSEPVQVSHPEPPQMSRPVQTGMPGSTMSAAPAAAPSVAPNGNGSAARPSAPRPESRNAAAKPPAARQEEQLPLAPLVSVKQVGRFRAIARSNGWTEQEQTRLLTKFGFSRAEEITRDAYDRICTALENPVILTEVRAEIDEELDFGLE
jgi:hypothetical protein